MKELYFIISLLFLKIFLFDMEFIVYITFFSLFFIIYVISVESALNYFNDERLSLKNAILTQLMFINKGINMTNAETLEIQTLKVAQFVL